jgi:hypothetical protein
VRLAGSITDTLLCPVRVRSMASAMVRAEARGLGRVPPRAQDAQRRRCGLSSEDPRQRRLRVARARSLGVRSQRAVTRGVAGNEEVGNPRGAGAGQVVRGQARETGSPQGETLWCSAMSPRASVQGGQRQARERRRRVKPGPRRREGEPQRGANARRACRAARLRSCRAGCLKGSSLRSRCGTSGVAERQGRKGRGDGPRSSGGARP